MAGIFTIKPSGQSDITCTLGESKTVNYFVVQESIVMNEAQRYKVAYASGDMGGQVSGSQSGLVQTQFEVWIFGSTMENRLSSLRTLVNAIINEDGGYIQYRPRGLGDSILSTYYHYLSSAPPQVDSHMRLSDASPSVVQAGRSPGSPAIRCRCQVMTKAWATSDPSSPVSIVSQTTVDNIDDADDDNHITIDSSLIKGDVLFPVVRISDNTGNALDRFIIHKRRMRTASNDRLDYIEGEDAEGEVSTEENAAYSGGSALLISGNGSVYFALPAMDSTYHGHITPIVFADVESSSDEWSVEIIIASKSDVIADNYKTLATCGERIFDISGFWAWDTFDEFQYPVSDVPFFVTDESSPSLDDWACAGLYLGLWIDREEGENDNLLIDFIHLAKTDEYLSKISMQQFKYLEYGDVIISSFDDVAYQESGVGEYHAPVSQSVPATGLMMRRGHDYLLSFYTYGNNSGFDQAAQIDVTITGIYGTIYPFEES